LIIPEYYYTGKVQFNLVMYFRFGLLILRIFITLSTNTKLFTQCCSGDKIENEMGGECSAYGGKEKHVQGFGWES